MMFKHAKGISFPRVLFHCHRCLKVLDNGMKVSERILEKFIRRRINIHDINFPRQSSKSGNYKKNTWEKEWLYLTSVEKQKAFDSVSREVVQGTMRSLLYADW